MEMVWVFIRWIGYIEPGNCIVHRDGLTTIEYIERGYYESMRRRAINRKSTSPISEIQLIKPRELFEPAY